jgi:hypothetical protein
VSSNQALILAAKSRGLNPISSQDVKDIVLLLSDPALWIDRKVESIQFNGDGSTRRSVSFDFWLPEPFRKLGFAPLTPLSKKDLRSLNVSGSDGRALSTLIKQDNADKAVQILASGITQTLMNQDVKDFLTEIVMYVSIGIHGEDLEFKRRMLGVYDSILGRNKIKEQYLYLAEVLIEGFLLWVEIPKKAKGLNRHIVKISYEEPINDHLDLSTLSLKFGRLLHLEIGRGFFHKVRKLKILKSSKDALFGYSFKTPIFPNWSARYHFEVRAPLGLLVKTLWLGTTATEESKARNFEEDVDCPVQIGHTSLFGYKNLPNRLFAHIEIAPDRQGFPRIVMCSALVVLFILGLPVFVRAEGFDIFKTNNLTTVAPLLLFGPALLFGYLARPVEHGIMSSRLLLFRVSLYCLSGCLVFASAVLSGIFAASKLWRLWRLDLGAAALGSIFVFYIFFQGTVRLQRYGLPIDERSARVEAR